MDNIAYPNTEEIPRSLYAYVMDAALVVTLPPPARSNRGQRCSSLPTSQLLPMTGLAFPLHMLAFVRRRVSYMRRERFQKTLHGMDDSVLRLFNVTAEASCLTHSRR